MERQCVYCKQNFEVERVPSGKYSKRRFCSKECEQKYNEENFRVRHTCPVCGKEFVYERLANGNYNKRKYCSIECREKADKQTYGYTICKICGKTFERKKTNCGGYSEQQYCDDCIKEAKYSICTVCGEKFLPKDKSKYCDRCREEIEHKQTHRICTHCGKEFKVERLASGKLNGKEICEDCAKQVHEKAHFGICRTCGKRFEYSVAPSGYISKSLYCSDECYDKNYSMNKEKYNEKLRKTCLERYGVAYPCLLPQCQESQGNIISKINQNFAKLLENNDITFKQEYLLHDQEKCFYSYDFYIPSLNTLIEINPTFTHTCVETGVFVSRDKDYHINKTQTAINNGFRCINVWDWDDWDKIIQLLKPKTKLYARKLKLKEISKQLANNFINIHHLQGSCYGNLVNLGLFNDEELVQVMTFGKPRYNKNYEWELLRLCSHSDYIIIGGAEKLFKYFINEYSPISIISYCDISKFVGHIYEKLNFKLKYISLPQKIWSSNNDYITDNLLRQRGFDQLIGSKLNPPEIYGKNTNNEELMLQHKWLPIYDCGQKIFEWYEKEEKV